MSLRFAYLTLNRIRSKLNDTLTLISLRVSNMQSSGSLRSPAVSNRLRLYQANYRLATYGRALYAGSPFCGGIKAIWEGTPFP